MSEDEALPSDSILAAAADDGATIVFDVPSFVRRGQDVEFLLATLDERCRNGRLAMLDMVHTRLRQWAKLAIGADDWRDAFAVPVAYLWDAASAPAPNWARHAGTRRARRAVARDLVASVERFNARWAAYVDRLDTRLVNDAIENYNKYYIMEKECVLGSSRLAAQRFTPLAAVSTASILDAHPPIPVPTVVA
ncbi:hypothetical protein [Paludisphaera sp.]|uniref:hypothetical protein n=1 Tax=Paludisphaera sp. TaxID=2017432 RepID=UPI00301CCFAE